MKCTLTLCPVDPNGEGPVCLYEVGGLPVGEMALIAETEISGRWEISHTKHSVLGDWAGKHKTPEAALAFLQELKK